MNRNQANAATNPIAPSTKNGQGQPKRDTSQPASGEKMPTAKYEADANSEVTRPRSSLGNHITAMRALAGKLGASMKPRMKRSANNSATTPATPLANLPTNPSRNVASDQMTSVTP